MKDIDACHLMFVDILVCTKKLFLDFSLIVVCSINEKFISETNPK